MMTRRRVFALIGIPVAVLVLWTALAPGDYAPEAQAQQAASDKGDMRANLNQAAESVVAAAMQGVSASRSEQQILERTDLSVEALRILGLLGASGTDMQATKLLDDVQAKVSPAAAEVLIRMRLARQLQRWSQLSSAERDKALKRFVSDVQSSGLTPGHADLLLRLTDNLEMGGQGALVANAIQELLPAFQNSTEPEIQRRTPVMQGIVHRLNLAGKPLELEGTLLDGSEFHWGAYRGKVVLVDFFANWCQVCREEVPITLQAYAAYKDKGFEVVGVSLDKQPQLAKMYQKETGFQFPTLFSSDSRAMEWKSPMAVKYGVTSLPRAILVDQQGNVVTTVARGERLIQHLHELLGPPGRGFGGGVGQLDGQPTDDGTAGQSEVVPTSFDDSVQFGSEGGEAAVPSVPEDSAEAGDSGAPAPTVPEE
jgi:thiol-disulfide isomerase/thioredoxin